jgi:predicted RNase H-like HicB family nuclease
MEQCAYDVTATWDDEAKVWVAESNDVPGLVTEAPTLEALQAKIRVLVPELLELNRQGPDAQ